MVLDFALIVVINNVEQPDVSYWASIYKCNSYAKAIEHGQVSSKDRYSNLDRSQVNVTAYCKPVYVEEDVELLD